MIIQPKVTQEDIDEGMRLNCERCPEALALSRACGQRMTIEGPPYKLSFYPVVIYGPGLPVPYEIYERISDFDMGLPMLPHEWPPVEVPDDWVKGAE